ncbi:class I SAM-dependent methyltransferase [Ideonella sp. B7]|uniref:class I SAM-dependent methyltransferase n=1 Tax=Ideonella benzenivorans TaxID=2831643 RepID=UPI001CEC42C4|nr:class I SAM-dependent methyltransferase [Ideonella benzenivorans]MCA6216185.1 class I SAM-dependent methyltransferase [Ideonella benzenivorans]
MPLPGRPTPSNWITRWAGQLPPGARVLDLACGNGRHLRWLAAHGFQATGIDRDTTALTDLAGQAEILQGDLEAGPWPLAGRQFEAVVVTHYLWRPRWAELMACVAPGGWLLYETFSCHQALIGKPSRPDFLLQPGELLARCLGWQIVAYEDGFLAQPDRFVQRIAAVRPGGPAPGVPARHPLPFSQLSQG